VLFHLPGSWFHVRNSRFGVRGSGFGVRRSEFVVQGSRFQVLQSFVLASVSVSAPIRLSPAEKPHRLAEGYGRFDPLDNARFVMMARHQCSSVTIISAMQLTANGSLKKRGASISRDGKKQ
jgi:hypothetical protein